MFTEQADKATGAAAAMPPLRTLYRDRLLVLAGLDLASTVENEPVLPFTAVGEHLSDLADAALDAALNVVSRSVCGDAPPPALAVIAMGKCGARELNYVSDVDVIFVTDDGSHGSLGLATRIAGEMMRLAGDAFFEVDAALRPEGKQGQLVRTLDSHVAYYQRWAKTWEFQALLKARPAAGDAELGQQLHRGADADGVDGVRARGLRSRGAGDAPARRGTGARRGADPRAQARQRRSARRRVRGPAAAIGARPQRRLAARGVDGRRARGAGRRRLHRPRRRRQPDGVLRVPAAARTPAAAAAAQAHPHAARGRRRRGDALAGPRGAHAPRRPPRCARRAARGTQTAEPPGVAAARQAVLPTAAGVGRPPHWDCPTA